MNKKPDIYDRSKKIATYILENNVTLREAAKYFGLSKSTIHNDVTVRLRQCSPILYAMMVSHLKKNIYFGRIRGGINCHKKNKD